MGYDRTFLSEIDILVYPIYLSFFLILFWKATTKTKIGYWLYFALVLRMIMSFFNALLAHLQLVSKDVYFVSARQLSDVFWKNPIDYFLILFTPAIESLELRRSYGVISHLADTHDSTFFVCKVGSVFETMSFGSYMTSVMFFGLLAHLGFWFVYKFLVEIFPKYRFELIFPVFFIPNQIFWSSAYMKEAPMFFGLGLLLYSLIKLYKLRKIYLHIPLFFLGFLFCATVKGYIAYTAILLFFYYVLVSRRELIQSKIVRYSFTGLAVGGALILTFVFIGTINSLVGKAIGLQSWISYQTEASGSSAGYSFGVVDRNIMGLVKNVIPATNVSLFRPYLWEARSVIQILAALEALLTLFFTLFILFKVGVFTFFKYIFYDYRLRYLLLYALFVLFVVGFSTMNFGSLLRYKIPVQPFYYAVLILIYCMHNRGRSKMLA